MEKLDIAFVLPGSAKQPIGGYKVVYEYANFLISRGHCVTIYYFINNSLRKYPLPKVVREFMGKILVRLRPRWFALDKMIKQIGLKKEKLDKFGKHDIIIATAVNTAEIVNNLPSSCGEKIYFIQGYENWSVSTEYLLQTYNFPMRKIIVAKWLKESIDSYTKKDSILVSNSINTDIFNITNDIETRNKMTIVFHYRSAEKKGCKYAIEAINKLYNDYKNINVFAVSNEKKPSIIPDYIHYYYNINAEEVAKINNKASIFLCSSIEEGFGLPGLEGMACGCALVSSDYKGVHEYAVNGVNALLVDRESADALYNALKRLIEDDELRVKIAKAGANTGKEKALNISAEKFEEALVKTIQGKKILNKNGGENL